MRNFFEMSIWFGNRAQWTHNNLYKTNSKFLRKISGYGWEGKRGGGMEVEGLISLAGFISSMYVHKIFHTNMLDIIINCTVIQEKKYDSFSS